MFGFYIHKYVYFNVTIQNRLGRLAPFKHYLNSLNTKQRMINCLPFSVLDNAAIFLALLYSLILAYLIWFLLVLENVFSTLVGLQFLWHLTPRLVDNSSHHLVRIPLRETHLSDCGGFCGDMNIRFELEDKVNCLCAFSSNSL